jgi:hypothetical protein
MLDISPIKYDKYEDAWLRIGDTKTIVKSPDFFNPLMDRTAEEKSQLGLRELRVMTDPAYLALAAKLLLNINLLPEQSVILEELWTKQFPMFIAARGWGKALHPDELVRVQHGWKTIKAIEKGDKVYGGDGKLCNVTGTTFLQKNLNFYRITLRDGRTIDSCEDHQWKVWDHSRQNYRTVSTKDMINSYYTNRKFGKSFGIEYRYAIPTNSPLIDEEPKDCLIHPYIVGVLLGDGCFRGSQITITSNDPEVADRFNSLLPNGYQLVKHKDKYTYGVKRTDKTVLPFKKLCSILGFGHILSDEKFIPEQYKYGDTTQRLELLKGLMDTDGYSSKNSIEYYTVSPRLSADVLDLVRSLGISCRHSLKEAWYNGKRYKDCHRIRLYTKEPVFTLERKLSYLVHPLSKQGVSKFTKSFITNIEYIGKSDGYCIQVDSYDHTYITKDYIVTHNSFLLAIYAMLRLLLTPCNEDGSAGCKIVIVGAAFRQSKIIFDYMDTLWHNSPIYRSLAGTGKKTGPSHDTDRWTMNINGNFAIAIPLGDGSKIRGLRATIVIADEFASISPTIYDTVVGGFGVVKSSPWEGVQDSYRRDALIADDLWTPTQEEQFSNKLGNQSIVSGTADYGFKHFATYWKKHSTYIKSHGDINELKKALGDAFNDEEAFKVNPKKYSVIRLPYELVPKGFMDEDVILRAKATVNSSIYAMEYGAVFVEDSDGYFKRSLIESCVANESTIEGPHWAPWCPRVFDAVRRGTPGCHYVYGIDPASEADNFSIVVLEVHPNHQRVVYCWTTKRSDFIARKNAGLTDITDFNAYCARKIRDLMKVFPLAEGHPLGAAIGLDAQGGGISIMEALHDADKIRYADKEQPIWPVIDPDKKNDYDLEAGLHVLEMVQFARADWTYAANTGMRKDLEDKVLLFPRFDPISLEMAFTDDGIRMEEYKKKHGKELVLFDTLEDCVLEIEELKNELTCITHTVTGTGVGGRDRWDVPEVKLEGGKKGRIRKDRYSALLIANSIARSIARAPVPVEYDVIGGFAKDMVAAPTFGDMYKGPAWFTDKMNQQGVVYGVARR